MSAARQGGLNDQQKKMIAVVAFVIVGVGVLGYELMDAFGGGPPAPPSAPVILSKTPDRPVPGKGATVAAPPGYAARGAATEGSEAKKVGTSSGELDPTLHMEAMRVTESLVYTGRGRNIFATGPTIEETKIAEAKHDRKPLPQPIVPVRVSNPGPPPLPPINLKFFGTATRGDTRRALLLHGDDVFLASPGDIVDRRYKVISIAANSIVIEDLPNNNRQTLPLLAN